MTTTTDCPHTNIGLRECAGCTQAEDDGTNERWCDGEATGRVYRDSDGDAGVINGIRFFVAVEDLELSCGCQLSEAEEQQATDALCEGYVGGDDLADMYETEARREAGI